MTVLLVVSAGLLCACGTYLLLGRQLSRVVIGIGLLGHGVNILLVTSGGKKIAPQPIEAILKRSPLVSEAILLGDGRKYAAALVVPDFAALERRLKDLGRPLAPREELVKRPDVLALYQEIVDGLNRELSQYERIKRIALLPKEFSIETGELTPTLKVKRKVIEERWREQIEDLYRE